MKKIKLYTFITVFIVLYFLQLLLPVSINVKILDGEQNIIGVRWDNGQEGYPFSGENVHKEVTAQNIGKINFISVIIPRKSQYKLRFDLKPATSENISLSISNITIRSLFYSTALDAEDIASCYSGLNGAKTELNGDIFEVTIIGADDPYIQTMERADGKTVGFSILISIFSYSILALFISTVIEKVSPYIITVTVKVKSKFVLKVNRIRQMRYFVLAAYYGTCFASLIVIETFSRKSLFLVFEFMRSSPLLFLCNYAILCLWFTLIFAALHKITCFLILAIVPLLFTVSNFFLLKMRGTPMVWQDLKAAKFGMAIFFDSYSKKFVIIAAILALIFLLAVIIISYKQKSENRRIKYCIANFVVTIFIVFSIYSSDRLINDTWNQSTLYLQNGLILNFYDSYARSALKPPSEYTPENIEQIKSATFFNTGEEISEPNIIILQLEAFMDPLTIPGIQYLVDPIPNFRKLMENYSSGQLRVSVFGGATVNTEFEILTGLPTKYLGLGDYPYLTKLTYEPMESLAHYLLDDYQTTALHNWYGDFYNRDKVFPNLGFERFISKENIVDGEYDSYYMSDICFSNYIPQILNESPERDFIYGITVQSHGPYISTKPENSFITATGDFQNELLYNITQYVNILNKVDIMIGNLITYLDTITEPTILFLFGDHQPALDLLNNPEFLNTYPDYDKYLVPYVCYTNWDSSIVNKDMFAYQVSSYLLNLCQMPGGFITDFHNTFKEMPEYENYLEIVQYDIISGKDYLYDCSNPYKKVDTVYGLLPMEIHDVESKENSTYIYGANFTPSCGCNLKIKFYTLK